MRDFYNARNKIAHGDEEERLACLRRVNVPRVEEYLRKAIKVYINKMTPANTHAEIIRSLDSV